MLDLGHPDTSIQGRTTPDLPDDDKYTTKTLLKFMVELITLIRLI